jgi:hypothetical protein
MCMPVVAPWVRPWYNKVSGHAALVSSYGRESPSPPPLLFNT